MNFTEGMRRVGVVLGLCGFMAGCFFGYIHLRPLLAQRAQSRTFKMLVSSPVVTQELGDLNATSAAATATSPWLPVLTTEINRGGIRAIHFGPWVGYRGIDPSGRKTEKYRIETDKGTYEVETAPVDLSKLSIEQLEAYRRLLSKQKQHYSANDVIEIETEDGKAVHPTDPPPLWTNLQAPVFPILGFLLPWGAIRVLTWVVTGFFTPPR